MSCQACDRPGRYRVKTVGAEWEALACGLHLAALILTGLDHATPTQGKRVQVTSS